MNGQRLGSVPGYSNQFPSLSGKSGSKAMKGRGVEKLFSVPPLLSVFCGPLGLSAGFSPSTGLCFYGTLQSLRKCEDILSNFRAK